jgi:hypothetical protein
MSPRPYWKGYLKLSLVSCPIAVHAACSSPQVRPASPVSGRQSRAKLRRDRCISCASLCSRFSHFRFGLRGTVMIGEISLPPARPKCGSSFLPHATSVVDSAPAKECSSLR